MRLLILGGTGPSGLKVIDQALQQDHTLVVYVRSPQKLPKHITSHPSVKVVKGDLTDTPKLSEAIQGVEAIISALGPIPSNPKGTTPVADAYKTILGLMKEHGVRRILLMGGPSVRDPHDRFSVVYKALVIALWLLLPNVYADVIAIGNVIRAADADVEWTLARFPFLNNKPKKEYVVGYVGDWKTWLPVLSREAAAAFILDELRDRKFVRQMPLVTSP
ncbi:NAD-P-binding protein [Trametes elegans]|nr:NAD-P-binding protein [Trametes elegans]